ncbi:hypothetical protein PUN28_000757 [Cardiocondyla obscurior]|uniref:Uncharacterized protein n=1 Tax=Cardiocondyla obscurior TaxID=286306 RepID=A0AAW2H0Z1_9HYME
MPTLFRAKLKFTMLIRLVAGRRSPLAQLVLQIRLRARAGTIREVLSSGY